MTKSLLHDYVHLLIEQMKMKEADVTDGSTVPWGSPEHIIDLEGRIESLNLWRNKQPRGSAARANYARLIDQLRSELRSAIRFSQKSSLNEEMITVIRKDPQDPRKDIKKAYDADFNAKGNISRAFLWDIGPTSTPNTFRALGEDEYTEQLAGLVPKSELIEKLESLPPKALKRKISDPETMVSILNKHWKDTLHWDTPKGKGKGELQMRLAFVSDPAQAEPDFVGPGIALSLKYTGASGKGDVQSGEKDNVVGNLIAEIKDLLGVDKLSQVTPDMFGAMIDESLVQLKPADAKKLLESLKAKVNALKLAVCQEHGANGIMMSDDANGFYYVSPGNALEEIRVYMIKHENRIRFFGPKNTTSRNYDDILEEKLATLAVSSTKRSRKAGNEP
jgi:hypothetical protein